MPVKNWLAGFIATTLNLQQAKASVAEVVRLQTGAEKTPAEKTSSPKAPNSHESGYGKNGSPAAAKFSESTAKFRGYFRDEVLGKFYDPLLPFNARSRKIYENEKWVGYDVVLDVFPDVFAWGVLLLPKDTSRFEGIASKQPTNVMSRRPWLKILKMTRWLRR